MSVRFEIFAYHVRGVRSEDLIFATRSHAWPSSQVKITAVEGKSLSASAAYLFPDPGSWVTQPRNKTWRRVTSVMR